eukprot:TRINITY_DN63458_c0_g1_i1.p1 TRINITY_DN63458_c0_g1~~TRINITY_DN63458_c0_g1_i1.p1  ORF type:complete len:666 (+),score=73.08 TRINITY_DN63458_c0_g1_i1:89-2086(+)
MDPRVAALNAALVSANQEEEQVQRLYEESLARLRLQHELDEREELEELQRELRDTRAEYEGLKMEVDVRKMREEVERKQWQEERAIERQLLAELKKKQNRLANPKAPPPIQGGRAPLGAYEQQQAAGALLEAELSGLDEFARRRLDFFATQIQATWRGHDVRRAPRQQQNNTNQQNTQHESVDNQLQVQQTGAPKPTKKKSKNRPSTNNHGASSPGSGGNTPTTPSSPSAAISHSNSKSHLSRTKEDDKTANPSTNANGNLNSSNLHQQQQEANTGSGADQQQQQTPPPRNFKPKVRKPFKLEPLDHAQRKQIMNDYLHTYHSGGNVKYAAANSTSPTALDFDSTAKCCQLLKLEALSKQEQLIRAQLEVSGDNNLLLHTLERIAAERQQLIRTLLSKGPPSAEDKESSIALADPYTTVDEAAKKWKKECDAEWKERKLQDHLMAMGNGEGATTSATGGNNTHSSGVGGGTPPLLHLGSLSNSASPTPHHDKRALPQVRGYTNNRKKLHSPPQQQRPHTMSAMSPGAISGPGNVQLRRDTNTAPHNLHPSLIASADPMIQPSSPPLLQPPPLLGVANSATSPQSSNTLSPHRTASPLHSQRSHGGSSMGKRPVSALSATSSRLPESQQGTQTLHRHPAAPLLEMYGLKGSTFDPLKLTPTASLFV